MSALRLQAGGQAASEGAPGTATAWLTELHEVCMPSQPAELGPQQACLTVRMHLVQVQLTHRGRFEIKGVKGPQTVIQIGSAHLAGRTFPETLRSAKARQVGRALGLQVSISFGGEAHGDL